MLARLLILVAVVAAVLWLLHWFRRTPPQRIASVLRRVALYGAIALAVLLAASGHLNPLFAALAAAVPLLMRLLNLLQMLPAIQQVLRMLGISGIPGTTAAGTAGASGQTSSIRTRFLEMTLDHASGQMDGLVLEGPLQGRRLSELDLGQLRALLADCRARDAQSATLLEAYLDRTHGDTWREDEPPSGGRTSPTGEVPMTHEEALAILGLKPGANAEEIREAHRRLMQKFHPDRGGSDYLAAKINAAKRLLLGD